MFPGLSSYCFLYCLLNLLLLLAPGIRLVKAEWQTGFRSRVGNGLKKQSVRWFLEAEWDMDLEKRQVMEDLEAEWQIGFIGKLGETF